MVRELFDNLSYSDQIAIKDKLIRVLLERKPKYKEKLKAYERIIGDYDYKEDFVFVEDAILLGGKKNDRLAFETEMDLVIDDFCEIFEGKELVRDQNLKKLINELINKAEVTIEDFDTILNLFRKDARMKDMLILHDQYSVDERESVKPIMERESEYLKNSLGISPKELTEILTENPEMMSSYSELIAAFYTREYERDCLSLQVEQHSKIKEKELEELIKEEVSKLTARVREARYGTSQEPDLVTGYDNLKIFLKLLEQNEKKGISAEEFISKAINYKMCVKGFKRKSKSTTTRQWEICAETAIRKIFEDIVQLRKEGKSEDYIKKYITGVKFSDSPFFKKMDQEFKASIYFKEILYGLPSFITKDVMGNLISKYVSATEKIYIEQRKPEWSERIKQKHDFPELLFRAQDSKYGNEIIAADWDSRISPQTHIEQGSKPGMQTSFISTSKIFAISATYLSAFPSGDAYKNQRASVFLINIDKVYELMGQRLDIINDEKMALTGEKEFLKQLLEKAKLSEEQKNKITERLSIIENEETLIYVDREELPEGIIDFSQGGKISYQEGILRDAGSSLISSKIDKSGKEKKYEKVRKYAPASREVLFKGIIPKEAIVEIDPILYDALLLTEDRRTKRQEKFLKDIAKNPVEVGSCIEKIMQENPEETFGLNEHELYFLQEYYINNMPIESILTIYDYDKELIAKKNNISERVYEQSMRTQVIKKLLDNEQFRQLIKDNGLELPDPQKSEVISEMIIPSTGISRHEAPDKSNLANKSNLAEKRDMITKISEFSVYDKAKPQAIQINYETDVSEKNEEGLISDTLFVSTGVQQESTRDILSLGVEKTYMDPREVIRKVSGVVKGQNDFKPIISNSVLKFSLRKALDKKYSAREAARQLSEVVRDTKRKTAKSKKTNTQNTDEIEL